MTTRVPSLNWLRVFEAAARTESFARAAAQLNMSAAAVSQQVKALETQLGTPLFLRHAHSVTLTEAGRAYLPSVQQSLLMLETATSGLFGDSRETRLYVQSVLLFAQGILAPALEDFMRAHPAVNLVLSTGGGAVDFTNQFADLRIVFGNPAQFGNESDFLLSELIYPVALPGIADAVGRPEDLLRYPLIDVSAHRAGWPQLFEALRLSPPAGQFIFVDDTIMAASLAAEGVGIALARAPASNKIVQRSGLTRCLPEIEVPGREGYHLVYEDRALLRAPSKAFRAWLLDFLSRAAA